MRLAARYVALYVFCLCVRFDGTLNCDQLPDGAVLLWFHLFLGLDVQRFRSHTVETCCRACVYQCIFAVGKFCRLVGLIRCLLPGYRTFTVIGINFILTDTHGKSPGVRPTPIRSRFAFPLTCSALPCASSSDRYSQKRTKICRSASPREAEGTDIYFKRHQYDGRDDYMEHRFSTQATIWP